MVYKHKNNKRARSIAARKLQKAAEAAATAAAARIAPVGVDDDQGAAVEYCDACRSSLPSAGDMAVACAVVVVKDKFSAITAAAASLTEANARAADAEDARLAKQSDTQQRQPGDFGDWSSSDTSGLLFSAPPTPTDLARLNVANRAAGLPSMLAATHLPCTPNVTPCSPQRSVDAGGEGDYVAYMLSDQLNDAATVSMTIWGVYSLRCGDCLQVVHWHHRPATQVSPVANGDHHSSSTCFDAQQTKELIMRVDAAGLCFMLAPSSLVSVEGGGAAGSMTPASVSSESDAAAPAAAASADVYWMIPSVMKESFFALLQAQEWLREAPLRHPTSEARAHSLECQGWCVRPHPSQWASITPCVEATARATEACESPESPSLSTVALVAPKRKAKKTKRQRSSQSSPRAQAKQQPVITAAADASQQMDSTAQVGPAAHDALPSSPLPPCRIPYVAAVQRSHKGGSGAAESHLPLADVPAAADAPVVLLIGNRIAAYPIDDACGAAR
ncbi:hypothetical protein JIQ42_06691 [Leishmania sp. Namibia]|uniref:hypothetical protein n=1 Tax=Leishmania sp. Namibia TaxID=2802991 RepID=UPI001B70AFBD|nr:hypothetical protein JIQ42_06691 [Leishmania sp. Namibia]